MVVFLILMEGYLNGEMIPTMDLYLTSHETEGKDEYEEDPFGTITIEDIMTINGYLNHSEKERGCGGNNHICDETSGTFNACACRWQCGFMQDVRTGSKRHR